MRGKVILFLLFFLLLGSRSVFADEISVATFTELQREIDTAKVGDTIILKPGRYEGQLVIKEPITLRGEKGVIFRGPPSGYPLTIEAENVTIENLQIEGGGSQNAGIFIKTNHNRIINNVIKDVFHGIYIKESYGNEITNNNITSIRNNDQHKGFGVYLVDSPQTKITGNYIHNLQDGVYVSFSDSCEVSSNKIENARYGIHTMDSKNVVITNNEVTKSYNGLMIMQSNDLYITDNFLHSNTTIDGAGMFIFDTFDSLIRGNVMKGNFKGIYFQNAQRNTVEFNTLTNNDIGFDLAEGSKGNTIYVNNFIKNTKQIISQPDNLNTFNKDQYGNYWDDQQMINLNDDYVVDFPYKSGDIFFNMTSKEPLLQVFFQSPAVYLWNKIEQFTPIPTDHFIIDEFPLIEPAPVKLDLIKSDQAHTNGASSYDSLQISLLLLLVIGSGLMLFKTRRKNT